MNELLCHLCGDYILQNHAQAMHKTSSSAWCLLHVVLYTLPFLFLTRSVAALAVICGTHFVIDRWSLAKRWPAFWGVGCEGWVGRKIREWRYARAVAWDEDFRFDIIGPTPPPKGIEAIRAQFQPLEPAPPFLAVWLVIICDNTAHLTINHLALLYL